jgi:excisionase family DNA binding protein
MVSELAAEEYLTDPQVAEWLHVDSRTTLRWRTDGGGPPFVRVGARRILYRRADVEAWLAARTFAHRAAEAAAYTQSPASRWGSDERELPAAARPGKQAGA